MHVRLRCKKCKYEFETQLRLNPLGSLKPTAKNPASNIKLDKDSLDKILQAAQGASREELEHLGLQIDPDEWEEAQERAILRRFILDNIKLSKERKHFQGEKYVVATEPWTMSDSFQDVDLASSEVKSMGVEDLRLIPGVTMQKKVYGVTRGREKEEMKGVKFLILLDGSGSMIAGDRLREKGKLGKALLIGKEIYELTEKLGFEYALVLFSDKAVRVEEKKNKAFWSDSAERAGYDIWNGGTKLVLGLEQFSEEEYKDANVVIISDMELADLDDVKEKITQLTKLTNTFKVILIMESSGNKEAREQTTRSLFPPDINLKVMVFSV